MSLLFRKVTPSFVSTLLAVCACSQTGPRAAVAAPAGSACIDRGSACVRSHDCCTQFCANGVCVRQSS